jgi:hypothetical protein
MIGIEIIGKGKGEASVEPAVIGVAALIALENVNH